MSDNDDPFTIRLLDCHQAILDDCEITADFCEPRLRRARDCLLMLEQLRRDSSTSVPEEISTRAQEDRAIPSTPVDSSDEQLTPFGKFELQEVLGRGAHGIVYKARDPVLGRTVALKVPRPETLESSELRQRLLRESQAAARLHHPNLLAVYEVGEVGPACFIASQYCPGPTLATWLREQTGPVDARLAAEMVLQLAETVQYVHGFGILHRDIKPSNILLDPATTAHPEPRADRVSLGFIPKLTDFGLARLAEGSQLRTHTGALLGTPSYMAPEQAEGRIHELGPATDIYALGVVLYELLAGRVPFAGQSDAQVLRKVCQGTPVPLRRLRSGLSRDLQAICVKCMEFAAHDRYESGGALADDLRRFLAGEEVRARRSGPFPRLVKWSRRQPVVASLAAMLLLTLVFGLAVALVQWRHAERLHVRAEKHFGQAHAAVADLHNFLLRSDEFDGPQYHRVKQQMLQSAVGYYERLLAERPDDLELLADLADARLHLAMIEQGIGTRAEAKRMHELTLPLWERLVREQPGETEHQYFLAKVRDMLGLLEHQAGNKTAALQHYEAALQLREAIASELPAEHTWKGAVAESQTNLSSLYWELGRRVDAFSAARKATEIFEERVTRLPDQPICHRLLAECYLKQADLCYGDADYPQCRKLCAQAQETLAAIMPQDAEVVSFAKTSAQGYHLAALAALQSDCDEEAFQLGRKSVETWRPLVERFPEVASYSHYFAQACVFLAKQYQGRQEYDEARAAYEQAIAADRRLVAKDSSLHKVPRRLAQSELAVAQMVCGESPSKAIAYLESAWARCDQVRNNSDENSRCGDLEAEIASCLAETWALLDNQEQAATWQRRSLDAADVARNLD